MDNINLKEDKERHETLLGVKIEYNLKWHKTIDDLRSKLKTRLAGMLKLKHTVSFAMLKVINQGTSILSWCTVSPSMVGVTKLIFRPSNLSKTRLPR